MIPFCALPPNAAVLVPIDGGEGEVPDTTAFFANLYRCDQMKRLHGCVQCPWWTTRLGYMILFVRKYGTEANRDCFVGLTENFLARDGDQLPMDAINLLIRPGLWLCSSVVPGPHSRSFPP